MKGLFEINTTHKDEVVSSVNKIFRWIYCVLRSFFQPAEREILTMALDMNDGVLAPIICNLERGRVIN